MRRMKCGVLMISVLLAASARGQSAKSQEDKGAVHTQMHNVVYHFTPTIIAHIRDLGGELLPADGYALPVFDDKNSFSLRIEAAEIAISQRSLANALNSYVFAAKDAPLKDVLVLVEKDLLKIKGKLHNKGDVGFEVEGKLSPTDDGKIRLHAEKIRALHLPVKGLMDLFGVDIADLIKNGRVSGVQAEKDDIILDPGPDSSASTHCRTGDRDSPAGRKHRAGVWGAGTIRLDPCFRGELHAAARQSASFWKTNHERH